MLLCHLNYTDILWWVYAWVKSTCAQPPQHPPPPADPRALPLFSPALDGKFLGMGTLWVSEFCFWLLSGASEIFWGIQITEDLQSILQCSFLTFFGLFEMTFELVHACYSLPKWQAVKLICWQCTLTSDLPKWQSTLIKLRNNSVWQIQISPVSWVVLNWNLYLIMLLMGIKGKSFIYLTAIIIVGS